MKNAFSEYEIPGKFEGEIFLPITRYKDIEFENLYYISNFGRVYSIYRGGRFLSPGMNHKGYLAVALSQKGTTKFVTKVIHRLEMSIFRPIPNMDLYQVNHIDGNKTNNQLDNLEWCTQSYNIKHAYRTGLMDMSCNRLLTDQDVQYIRNSYLSGKSMVDIWKESYQNVIGYDSLCDICNNITYFDPNYIPRISRLPYLTEDDVKFIRDLYMNVMFKNDIWKTYYNDRDRVSIYDICNNNTHFDPNYNPQKISSRAFKIDKSDVDNIRKLYNNGLKVSEIHKNYYSDRSYCSVQAICKNKSYFDPNYIPRN